MILTNRGHYRTTFKCNLPDLYQTVTKLRELTFIMVHCIPLSRMLITNSLLENGPKSARIFTNCSNVITKTYSSTSATFKVPMT